jgi:hypothetical protein
MECFVGSLEHRSPVVGASVDVDVPAVDVRLENRLGTVAEPDRKVVSVVYRAELDSAVFYCLSDDLVGPFSGVKSAIQLAVGTPRANPRAAIFGAKNRQAASLARNVSHDD